MATLTLAGLLFSTAVTAAPTLTTDEPAGPTWVDTAADDPTTWTDSQFAEVQKALEAYAATPEGSKDPDLKFFTGRSGRSNFRQTNWASNWDWNHSGPTTDFLRRWLPDIKFPTKTDWDRPDGSSTAAVPAPSAILLSTIGLLLVRGLRQRRIII